LKIENESLSKQLTISSWQENRYFGSVEVAETLFSESDKDSGFVSQIFSPSAILSPNPSTNIEFLSLPEASLSSSNRLKRENETINQYLSKFEQENLELSNKLGSEGKELKNLRTELNKERDKINNAEKEIENLTQKNWKTRNKN